MAGVTTRSRLERLDDWVPPALLAALRRAGSGQRIHLVGGALRDRWLGRESPDFDLVADGDAAGLGRRLARRLAGRFVELAADRFASYRIVAAHLVIDLWGRGDATVHADLERRDLTINAMAMAMAMPTSPAIDGAGGRLIDPFDGLGDLERRLLRATTERGFDEDPLRVLRLARFAAALDGFRVEPATLDLARAAAPAVRGVAVERVREEVWRLLRAPGRARGLDVLAATGLRQALWGRAAAGAPMPPLDRISPTRDRLTADLEATLAECDAGAVGHALLFAAGGGREAARASPLLSRRLRRRVLDLLDVGGVPDGGLDGRRFLHRWGPRWCEAAVFAALRAGTSTTVASRASRLAELARRHGRVLFELPTLLDGVEVGRLLGLPPGPEIGRALAAIEREQIAGRLRTAAEARAFLDRRRPRLNPEAERSG